MLRDKNLVPYSHQHQHALALCVRIQRALDSGDHDLARWNGEIVRAFDSEIRFHFEAEERFVFPAAKQHASLAPLVKELMDEHGILLAFYGRARNSDLDSDGLRQFSTTLSDHIRTEERQLFEGCQNCLNSAELQQIHDRTSDFFRAKSISPESCPMPGTSPVTNQTIQQS